MKLIFDLDGTLYRSRVPLEHQIIPEIKKIVSKITGLSGTSLGNLIRRFRIQYGGYTQGLAAEFNADPFFVSESIYANIDRSDICLDLELKSKIKQLKERNEIYVLTNSARVHAKDCLERIGIHDLIDKVFAFEESGFLLKPDYKVFDGVLNNLQSKANEFVFFDDSVRNLWAAHRIGMKVALVSNGVSQFPLFYEMHLQVEHLAPSYSLIAEDGIISALAAYHALEINGRV